MFSRVALNVTATVMPLYLTTALGFVGENSSIDTNFSIAAVPLSMYICSMAFSIFGQARVQRHYPSSRAPVMFIAALVIMASSLPLTGLSAGNWSKYLVYPCAGL